MVCNLVSTIPGKEEIKVLRQENNPKQSILTLKLSFLLLLVNEWNYLAAIFIKNENPMSYFISLDIHLAS